MERIELSDQKETEHKFATKIYSSYRSVIFDNLFRENSLSSSSGTQKQVGIQSFSIAIVFALEEMSAMVPLTSRQTQQQHEQRTKIPKQNGNKTVQISVSRSDQHYMTFKRSYLATTKSAIFGIVIAHSTYTKKSNIAA